MILSEKNVLKEELTRCRILFWKDSKVTENNY